MDEGKYNLTWQHYSDHLKSMMKELMMNEEFSDVTLVTEDKKYIKANINILSACSAVFKDILKKEKYTSQIMYLRGIQFSEIEPIIQFIYLGETKINEESIDEFLAVAKSLEVLELCKAYTKNETHFDSDSDKQEEHEPLQNDPPADNLEENMHRSNDLSDQKNKVEEVKTSNNLFECEQCHKTYTQRKGLINHTESVHEGVTYACEQCDYIATYQINLSRHIRSKHLNIIMKYACDQCDLEYKDKQNLTLHIQSKHEGIMFACDWCDQEYKAKSYLTKHIQSKHKQ